MNKPAAAIYFNSYDMPAEIADKIIQHIVEKEYKGLPVEWSNGNKLLQVAQDLLRPISIHADAISSMHRIDDAYRSYIESFTARVATEILLPTTVLQIRNPSFPKATTPNVLSTPISLEPHKNHILHLDVVVRISSAAGADYYPIELYRLQDNIAKLKT